MISGRTGRIWKMGPTVAFGVKGRCWGNSKTGKSKTGKSKAFLPSPAFQSPFRALYEQHLTGSQLAKENLV